MLKFEPENIQTCDPVDLQKMIFIYRALETGWCIRKLHDGRFEFKKQTNSSERISFTPFYTPTAASKVL